VGAGLGLATIARIGFAQGPARSGGPVELRAGAAATMATRDFWGAELGLARRTAGQGRFAVRAAGGDAHGHAGMWLSGSAEFVLRPGIGRGISPYAGIGLAFYGVEGESGAGYITANIGVESAPAARRGWYAEVGVGGGVRAALGACWRWFPKPDRPK